MVWMVCVVALLFGGCQQKPQERQYTEIIKDVRPKADPHAGLDLKGAGPHAALDTSSNPHSGMDMAAMGGVIAAPVAQDMLSWECPKGWKEKPGEHMRMASFYLGDDPKAIDGYIIALRGPAGVLESNLPRWSQQIGLKASDDDLKQMAHLAQSIKTKDGLDVKVFDFTTLQSQGKPSDKSLMAAMIVLGDTSIFVKMTGSLESVGQNKSNFLKLIGSIVRK